MCSADLGLGPAPGRLSRLLRRGGRPRGRDRARSGLYGDTAAADGDEPYGDTGDQRDGQSQPRGARSDQPAHAGHPTANYPEE
ncbi:hypothetical protein [Microbispora hainanensis]|uniref:hypothetical protein n=1 Tax=Microbispora hainanensis TaxID=568844 RepID=UPI00340F716B